jgi:phage repressor protein C with HTH and peptisase S24 domain
MTFMSIEKMNKKDVSRHIAKMRNVARLTQPELAKKMGVNTRTLARWEGGDNMPKTGVLEEIARICHENTPEGLSPHETDDLVRTPNSAGGWTISQPVDAESVNFSGSVPKNVNIDEYIFVPRYDVTAGAGAGSVVGGELVKDLLAYRTDYIRDELGISGKGLGVVSVTGDSMEPSISAGDSLLVNTEDKKLTSNGIYVINYEGGLIVKRIEVRFDTETIVLLSDNEKYSPQELTPDKAKQLNIVGKVVLVSKRV